MQQASCIFFIYITSGAYYQTLLCCTTIPILQNNFELCTNRCFRIYLLLFNREITFFFSAKSAVEMAGTSSFSIKKSYFITSFQYREWQKRTIHRWIRQQTGKGPRWQRSNPIYIGSAICFAKTFFCPDSALLIRLAAAGQHLYIFYHLWTSFLPLPLYDQLNFTSWKWNKKRLVLIKKAERFLVSLSLPVHIVFCHISERSHDPGSRLLPKSLRNLWKKSHLGNLFGSFISPSRQVFHEYLKVEKF